MKQISLKKNSILNVIKTVSSVIFPLITFPYVSRVLLPVNVGKVNFGSSFVSYFSLIATLGITTYAIRECSAVREDRDELSEKASEIFSINICTTIVAYILLILSLLAFRELDSYRCLIVIQCTSILFTTLGADWLNSAMEDFKYITLRTVFFQIVSLILMFIFVRNETDYLKYAAITVFSSSGANIANFFYRKKYCDVTFTKIMHWKRHFKPILFLFVMILSQTIFNSSDITMLGLMKGDYEVGIYSTAYKIKNIIAQVITSLTWVVMPRLSVYFSMHAFDKVNDLLKKALNVMITLGFPCIAGSIVLSSDIIEIIGGKAYKDASFPLIILMISFAIDLFGGSFLGNMICLPSKREKPFVESWCIAAILNIILNYFLIPIGGACAAAFTSTISTLMVLLWLIIKRDKRVEISYLEICKSPIIGTIVIIVYCLLIKFIHMNSVFTIIICVCGSGVLYSVILIKMKNKLMDEIEFFIKKVLKEWI